MSINSLNLKGDKNGGFSMLEIIISIAIISVGIVTIFFLFTTNLNVAIRNKNKLTAVYLAQEAIEVIRQKRDNLWFGGDPSFLDNTEFQNGNYIIFPENNDDLRDGWKIETFAGNERKKVYINNGRYIQSNVPVAWQETRFTRYIQIENNNGGAGVSGCDIDSCVKAIVYVSFGESEIVTVTAYLFDEWYSS